VDTALAARAKAALEGAPLPASTGDLADHAARAGAEPDVVEAIRALPDRRVRSLDDLREALAPVQPPTGPAPRGARPRPESGWPPGGDAYVDPGAQPGAVLDDLGPAGQ
jgi:hypothetical protein